MISISGGSEEDGFTSVRAALSGLAGSSLLFREPNFSFSSSKLCSRSLFSGRACIKKRAIGPVSGLDGDLEGLRPLMALELLLVLELRFTSEDAEPTLDCKGDFCKAAAAPPPLLGEKKLFMD